LKKRFVSLLTAGLLSICLSACANDAVSTSNMPIGDPIPVSDETSLAERSAVESSIESDENITDLTEESSDTDSDIANIDNSSADDESNNTEKDSATSAKDSKTSEKDSKTSEKDSKTSEKDSETAEPSEENIVQEEPEQKPSRPAPSSYYKSELTGEMIDSALQNQRPVAIMVDNEILTYPHYGINQADIVYEMMNSTANDRITRFMCIVKDYEQITRFGGVRSIRPTNFLVGFPYEAIFCHDGGPFMINDYLNKSYCSHLSGIFARYSRSSSERPSWATSYAGKSYAREFTEFVTYNNYKNPNTGSSYSGLKSALASAGFKKTYSSSFKGAAFKFADSERVPSSGEGATDATNVKLPYKHTSTSLKYNASTKTYDLYEYGHAHTDAADGNKVTSFKNVFLLSCSFSEYGEGYMIYNYYNHKNDIDSMNKGFYLTDGKVIPIKWDKTNRDTDHCKYYNAVTKEELVVNPGKIYINIVPEDNWGGVSVY